MPRDPVSSTLLAGRPCTNWRGVLADELFLPVDAEQLKFKAGQPVMVESRRGSARALAYPSLTVPRGQLFLPMHDAATNRLTFADFDPYSRQPSYKACAVRVRAITENDRTQVPISRGKLTDHGRRFEPSNSFPSR